MLRTARRLVIAAAAALVVAAGVAASPASAARALQQSANYTCGNAQVGVSPPRVWSNHGRPEQVVWLITVDRWVNGAWYTYSQASFRATFDYYGRNVTGWTMFNTRTGGRFINSRMNMPVAYRGYYRVGSAVAAPGRSSAVYVGGGNNHCFMP